jgi:hypothetical protein
VGLSGIEENPMRYRLGFALTLAAAMAGQSASARADIDFKDAQRLAERYVDNLAPKQGFRRISPIEDESLRKLLPGRRFVGVLFPQYPLGIDPPPPLKVANVLVVDQDGKLHPLTDIAALEEYCRANFPAASSKPEAAATLRAWLMLSQHMHTDGFYQFEFGPPFVIELDARNRPSRAQGTLNVKPVGGNQGRITASLTFDAAGRLASAKNVVKLVEGIRPICQASRLLDPDPLVRQMAKRELLVMGRMGAEYLRWQRAKASPELRQEIDRIWQQILAEGR